MSERDAWRYNPVGWLLFTASAVFFIWSTARAGDWIGVLANILFPVACLVLLAPVWRMRRPGD